MGGGPNRFQTVSFTTLPVGWVLATLGTLGLGVQPAKTGTGTAYGIALKSPHGKRQAEKSGYLRRRRMNTVSAIWSVSRSGRSISYQKSYTSANSHRDVLASKPRNWRAV